MALAQEESSGDTKPADDLLNLEGLERLMAFKLAARGVCTLEDLAEQGIDDLADIEGLTDEKPESSSWPPVIFVGSATKRNKL